VRAELGVHLAARLRAIRSPLVKETRCLGLGAGVDLVPGQAAPGSTATS
jgi:hypothetical protein